MTRAAIRRLLYRWSKSGTSRRKTLHCAAAPLAAASSATALQHIALPRALVIDISDGMLQIGIQKVEKQKLKEIITLRHGDSEAINFGNNTFDAITSAFGVRNFERLEKGLDEMLRVLKPGGKLVVLEFSKPRKKFFKGFYHFYMNVVAPKAGKWLSKNFPSY